MESDGSLRHKPKSKPKRPYISSRLEIHYSWCMQPTKGTHRAKIKLPYTEIHILGIPFLMKLSVLQAPIMSSVLHEFQNAVPYSTLPRGPSCKTLCFNLISAFVILFVLAIKFNNNKRKKRCSQFDKNMDMHIDKNFLSFLDACKNAKIRLFRPFQFKTPFHAISIQNA